jgi:TrmH family RNA methyltransferase
MHYTMPITQRLKKLIKSLHQKQFRDQNDLFVAEGQRLCEEIIDSDFQAELVVIKDSPTQEITEIVDHFADKGVPVYTAPKHQFDQICHTKTPQGIITVVNIKKPVLLPDEPFLALDAVADPGNIGTIIRTANWFGIKQIILGRDCADKFNPKTVRSTMGAIFKTQVHHTHDLPGFVKENFPKHQLLGASVNTKTDLESLDFKNEKLYGVFFGNEANGLSEESLSILDQEFIIPGIGNQESLNVAVSVGISLYHLTK